VALPVVDQAGAALDWLTQRKDQLLAAAHAHVDECVAQSVDRAYQEAAALAEQVEGLIHANGDLAAELLADLQHQNDAIAGTLDALKAELYGHQDMYGYRYKLLNQLHHQRVAFEQAVEAAWITWTQSRDLSLSTAVANADTGLSGFEGLLGAKFAEWDAAAASARADLGDQIGAKADALRVAVDESARLFNEKQAYKRHYIAGLDDYEKKERLTAKVDLEDQLFAEALSALWAGFGEAADGMVAWLTEELVREGEHFAEEQDAAGEGLGDALAEQLDRLGYALGDIGDAFFEAKASEVERLMATLYGYGYEEYQEGYEPVFQHQPEVVEKPVIIVDHRHDHVDDHHDHHDDHHDDHHSVSTYYSSESTYYAPVPAPVVVHKPHVPENVYHEPITGKYIEKPEVHGEVFYGEDPYTQNIGKVSEYSDTYHSDYSEHHTSSHHSDHSSYYSDSDSYYPDEPVY